MPVYTNARLVTPHGVMPGRSLRTENGAIAEVLDGAPQSGTDLEGLYLSPGFIDIHCHGGGGHDFMDGTAEAFAGALACHMRHGTTTMLPTATSADLEDLTALGAAWRAHLASPAAAALPHTPGLHLEGPYLAMEMRGAQDAAYIRTPADLPPQTVLDALGGPPLVWTVAPEIEGVPALCRQLAPQGVYFSAGHSDATWAQALAGVEAGFTMATHLYSAMSTIVRVNGYRVPGLVESALLLDELAAEVIADGAHLPPELLRLVVRTKGETGVILVTDAMRGAGMAPGPYKLGSLAKGQTVQVGRDVARMPDGVAFAGSIATADRLLKTMVRQADVPLHRAVGMLTANPAAAVGLAARKGGLRPGMDADLVAFDDDFNVRLVVIAGQVCHRDGV